MKKSMAESGMDTLSRNSARAWLQRQGTILLFLWPPEPPRGPGHLQNLSSLDPVTFPVTHQSNFPPSLKKRFYSQHFTCMHLEEQSDSHSLQMELVEHSHYPRLWTYHLPYVILFKLHLIASLWGQHSTKVNMNLVLKAVTDFSLPDYELLEVRDCVYYSLYMYLT